MAQSRYLHDGHGAAGAVFAYREQVRHNSYERQPHIFGAQAGQYSEGTVFGNYREPPKWWPGKQLENKLLPYTASRYCRDLIIWENGTDIPVERQGFVILGALGGQARKRIEQLGEEYIRNGGYDQNDINPVTGMPRHYTGPALIRGILQHKFPDNNEAIMLRTGIEFFSFAPRPGETLEVLFARFDEMLATASETAELRFSWQFRSWMLLSILRLTTKTWMDLLKEIGHRMPKGEEEYNGVKVILLRGRSL